MIYVGDTPLIKFDAGEDISDLSTTKNMNYKTPAGVTGTWGSTTLSGTQIIQFQAVTGSLSAAGKWQIQLELSDGTKVYRSTIEDFTVKGVLA